jgi:predicted small secreted protein
MQMLIIDHQEHRASILWNLGGSLAEARSGKPKVSPVGKGALAPSKCESLNSHFPPLRALLKPHMNNPQRIGLFLIALSLISGCSTWSGFGQDLQKLGRKIEKQGDKDKGN